MCRQKRTGPTCLLFSSRGTGRLDCNSQSVYPAWLRLSAIQGPCKSRIKPRTLSFVNSRWWASGRERALAPFCPSSFPARSKTWHAYIQEWAETTLGAVRWTPEQPNKTAQPKAHKYPTSHFSLFITDVVVVLLCGFCSLKKGLTAKICMLCFVITISILLNLLYSWILF